jgi:hypothetical protein
MELPIKTIVDLSKLRYFLIILSCFILFFSIFPIVESGLKRYDLLIGAILFFISSVSFWFLSLMIQFMQEKKLSTKPDKLIDRLFELSIILWIGCLILSFYFFINSIVI